MMKKLITAVIVLTSTSAWGSPIDWSQAELVAQRFSESAAMQHVLPQQWLRVERMGESATHGYAPFYVFNRADGNGFVIVAGDDAAPSVLGYSTQGSFGDPVPLWTDWRIPG